MNQLDEIVTLLDKEFNGGYKIVRIVLAYANFDS